MTKNEVNLATDLAIWGKGRSRGLIAGGREARCRGSDGGGLEKKG